MRASKVEDGMLVLEFACKNLRKMMRGNSECSSFAGILENLGLLSCSMDEAMKGLIRMKNIHDSTKPPVHVWNTVCLAAWILAMAEFLRSASPKNVSIVEDMLFYRGDAGIPVSSIGLPSAGELRMITIIAIYYAAVSEKMSAVDAVVWLLSKHPTDILVYVFKSNIKEGMRTINGFPDCNRVLPSFDMLIGAYDCAENMFDFMSACKVFDSICNSKFLFAFSVEAINVSKVAVECKTRDDIIQTLVFCLHGLKIQDGLPKERQACISWGNALRTLNEFKLQDIGSVNFTVQTLHKRSKDNPDLMQVRSKQLLASLKHRVQK